MSKTVGVFENDTVDFAELGGTPLFQQLNLVGLEALVRTFPSLRLAEGAELIAPGQPNQVVYVVLAGRLNVYEGDRPDEPIGVIQKGECVGLMSLIDRQPCRVRIVATEVCHLLALDEEMLLALINTSNAIARNVLFILMHYLRGKNTSAPERGRLQRQIERETNIDAVTGLYDQRWLDGMLERQIMRSNMDRKPLSVLAVEVDEFDQFNKEFGRDLGDHALATVGCAIGASVRPTDMVARHESNRFMVVLPETDAQGAEMVAARIRETVAQTEIEIPGACRLPPLTVTTGLVQMKAFVAGRKLVEDAIRALGSQDTDQLPHVSVG